MKSSAISSFITRLSLNFCNTKTLVILMPDCIAIKIDSKEKVAGVVINCEKMIEKLFVIYFLRVKAAKVSFEQS